MRKLMMFFFVLLIVAFMARVSKVEAFPLSVIGHASADSTTLTSLGGGLSTIDVTYTFTVIDDNGTGTGMNDLTLEFEKYVFNSISINDIYVTSPESFESSSIIGSSDGGLLTSGFGGSTAVTPEPATLMLLGSGFIGAGLYRWRRRRKK